MSMKFSPALERCTLERRYKRFLADVLDARGRRRVVHCPNTGSMLGCAEPGSTVWLSRSDNPKRKYAHTWELVQVRRAVRVGIHTGRSNALVREALASGVVEQLEGYGHIRAEVAYGEEGSRADFLLEGHRVAPNCILEVKNVTAAVERGVALFPDAVSVRGSKHLRELMGQRAKGRRAALCFCVQRDDVNEVRPADFIDPVYGQSLRDAIEAGVEVFAYTAKVSPREVRLYREVPVVCP